MAVMTFDTLKMANSLKAAGVPDKQAEAEANIFAEMMQVNLKELATKQDLEQLGKDLRQEMQQLGKDLRKEIQESRQETQQLAKDLRKEIQEGRQETQQMGKDIRAEFKQFELVIEAKLEKFRGEQILVRWMFGFILAAMMAMLVRMFIMKGPL
jgi:hypothetical protein